MNSESSLFGTLEQLLRNQPDVLGLFLTGSYADLTADLWSDLDALIVVSADAFCKYSACLDWLSPLGAFFAHETTPIENGLAVTIRLCLMSFQRFDLTIAHETLLGPSSHWAWLDTRPVRPVFSRLSVFPKNLIERTEFVPKPAAELSGEAFRLMIDRFWFRQTQIVHKVIRGDLLVAFHLCLLALEDCCILAMLLRDRATGTSVHKHGGIGNVLILQMKVALRNCTPDCLLDCAAAAGTAFDGFARSWSDDYVKHNTPFEDWLADVREELRARG